MPEREMANRPRDTESRTFADYPGLEMEVVQENTAKSEVNTVRFVDVFWRKPL